ncbi:hypothetical protein J8631_27755, partial [Serratia fonticola]
VHRKAVPERLAIDGRQRKFNPLLPGSVNCLLQPEPGCFPADIKQGAPAAGPECGQEPAQQIDVAGIEQRYYPAICLSADGRPL